jgi:hypothetical protein
VQDDELVPAEPGHQHVVRHGVRQPLGDPHQQLVAALVPERVVHDLEPVQVEEDDDRPGVPRQRPTAQRVLQVLQQHRPVRQPGEAVVRRLERQALHQLGAVDRDADEVAGAGDEPAEVGLRQPGLGPVQREGPQRLPGRGRPHRVGPAAAHVDRPRQVLVRRPLLVGEQVRDDGRARGGDGDRAGRGLVGDAQPVHRVVVDVRQPGRGQVLQPRDVGGLVEQQDRGVEALEVRIDPRGQRAQRLAQVGTGGDELEHPGLHVLPLLGLVLLLDVAGHHDDAADARLVDQAGRERLVVPGGAVGAEQPEPLAGRALAAGRAREVEQPGRGALPVLGVDDVEDAAAEQRALVVPEDAAGRRAGVPQRAVGVDRDDDVGHVQQQGALPSLGLEHGLLRGLHLRGGVAGLAQIALHGRQCERPAVLQVGDEEGRDGDRDGRPAPPVAQRALALPAAGREDRRLLDLEAGGQPLLGEVVGDRRRRDVQVVGHPDQPATGDADELHRAVDVGQREEVGARVHQRLVVARPVRVAQHHRSLPVPTTPLWRERARKSPETPDQPITVPELSALRARSRPNALRSIVSPVCSPAYDVSPRSTAAISRPTTGAFLNWLPLVPMATKYPSRSVRS